MKQCEIVRREGEPMWSRTVQCAFIEGHGGEHYFPSYGEDASDKVRWRAAKDREERLERGEHPNPEATEDERYQHHEALFQLHFTRCLELRPGQEPKERDELAELRVIAAAAQQWADNECGALKANNFGCGRASHDAECPYGIAERRLYDAVRDRERGKSASTRELCPECECRECADCDWCADHLQAETAARRQRTPLTPADLARLHAAARAWLSRSYDAEQATDEDIELARTLGDLHNSGKLR